MNFISFEYIFFFIITFLVFFVLNEKFKIYVLIFLSLAFYGYQGLIYLIVLLILILFSYFAALFLVKVEKKTKVLFFGFSCFFILSFLFFFKYYNFTILQLNQFIFSDNQFNLVDIILPLGISFYTFQILGYLTDVFRDKKNIEKSFVNYCLFISFFPQLVAGPIETRSNLIPQFKNFTNKNLKIEYEIGLNLILLGFFKKLVIADNLAEHIDIVYSNYNYFTPTDLLLTTYLFSFQILFDFSAYTDIARGSAKIFGINLTENFNSPYNSKSLHEFWKKWHISLTSWLKNYVYISLKGNSFNKLILFRNITIVFLLSSFWHGANWTFIVWGSIHLIIYLLERFLLKRYFQYLSNIKNFISRKFLSLFHLLLTFHIVNFSWVFFRSENIDQGISIINKIYNGFLNSFLYHFLKIESSINQTLMLRGSLEMFIKKFWFFLLLIIIYFLFEKNKSFIICKIGNIGKGFYYFLILILILLLGNLGYKEFIYFQF